MRHHPEAQAAPLHLGAAGMGRLCPQVHSNPVLVNDLLTGPSTKPRAAPNCAHKCGDLQDSPTPPMVWKWIPFKVSSTRTCCVVRSHWELKKSSLSWVKTGTSYSCTMGGSGRCSITFRWMVFDSSAREKGKAQSPCKTGLPQELGTINARTPQCHTEQGPCSP